MAKSLATKFRGMEQGVIKSVQEHGIEDTMLLYGVKTRRTFTGWLRTHTGEQWQDTHPLANLCRGEKHKLLIENRDIILDELEIFGKPWVMHQWHIAREDTLESLIKSDNRPLTKGLSELERARLDAREALRLARELKKQVDTFLERLAIIEEGRKNETRTVIELQESYASFTDTVSNQLSQGVAQFFKTLLEHGIKLDKQLPAPKKKALDVEDIVTGGKKAQLSHGLIKSTPENPLLETLARI